MNRGSEWNIWDLHVHTPESLVHNYKSSPDEDVWEQYIESLEALPKEIKVLGINDYIFIDGYRKVLEYRQKGRLKNIDLILPVIELRLARFCGHKQFKRINYHVIFSDELSADQIQDQFLNALTAKYQLTPEQEGNWSGVVTRESLAELGRCVIDSAPENERSKFSSPLEEGFNNLNLEVSNIEEALSKHIFEGKYITAVGKTEWDELKWGESSIAEKKTIINNADLVFTAAENVEAYNKSRNKLSEQCVNNLLLDCSDAHSFADSENKDRLGNCSTWIKANTTFEGLKQILFEPEERMKVQREKPEDKNIYQVIDYIDLAEPSFWVGRISLNPNLNTIIGGRSTGKSSLLKAIAAKHGNEDIGSNDFIKGHLKGVSIRWQDGNDQSNREIEYFCQGYMHDIARDVEKRNEIIKSVVRNKDQNGLLMQYEAQIEEASSAIKRGIQSIFQIQEKHHSLRRDLIEKGVREGIEKQLGLLRDKAAELRKSGKLTPEEQDQYEKCLQEIESYRKLTTSAESDLEILKGLAGLTLIAPEFKEREGFNRLSFQRNHNEVDRMFDDLHKQLDEKWKGIVGRLIHDTKEAKEEIDKELQNLQSTEIYKKGQRFMDEDKELRDVLSKLDEEEKKLQVIRKLQSQLEELEKEQKTLIDRVVEQHLSFKESAIKICNGLSLDCDGLKISIQHTLIQDDMRFFLETRLNQRGYERQGYVQDFPQQYGSKTEVSVRVFLNGLLSSEIQLKGGYTPESVAMDFLSRGWYRLDYSLKYQNDSFTQMSEGKQAFVILKLLLDFSDKKCPILIDQPEDSLDNRAIYKELVEYLKKKKKERQIILVTHNPNIVVGADAENIIIANQQGQNAPNAGGTKFQYINGALEDTKPQTTSNQGILGKHSIREHIYDILEGGKKAFEKREQKYGFKK